VWPHDYGKIGPQLSEAIFSASEPQKPLYFLVAFALNSSFIASTSTDLITGFALRLLMLDCLTLDLDFSFLFLRFSLVTAISIVLFYKGKAKLMYRFY
jgi:hypothetical protein